MTDTERLDFLEKFVNEEGAIMLHDGSKSNFGCSGLGLRPGSLVRTLREAIDECAGEGYSKTSCRLRWVQPRANNCILDEHHHKPGEFCQGCADLDPKARTCVLELVEE